MKVQVSSDAQQDIADILDYSHSNYGRQASGRYEDLITLGLEKLADDAEPMAAKSISCDGREYRLFHLRHIRQGAVKVANPRHFIAYRQSANVRIVLRLIHDSMDLPSQLQAL